MTERRSLIVSLTGRPYRRLLIGFLVFATLVYSGIGGAVFRRFRHHVPDHSIQSIVKLDSQPLFL
jgi:hypothetical protein